jgi:hypothetical protein
MFIIAGSMISPATRAAWASSVRSSASASWTGTGTVGSASAAGKPMPYGTALG